MRAKRKHAAGQGGLDLIEETFHLLRTAPLRVLAAYYIGALPFVLALLYFWGDMSENAFAHARVAGGAFGVAALFVWMKAWHVVYARRLWDEVCSGGSSAHATPRWTIPRLARMAVRQTILQTAALFVLPIALIVMLPFGYAYALCQNAAVLDDGGKNTLRGLLVKAWEQALQWQRQNHLIMWALSPFLMMTVMAWFLVAVPVVAAVSPDWTVAILRLYSVLLLLLLMPLSPFGIMIALNIASALLLAPMLLGVLFDVQTAFTRSPFAMINSSFFALVCGLTYLCMDPLMKAAYVLRCFHGQSLRTGEDLRAELKRLARKAAKAAAPVCLLTAMLVSSAATAQPPPPHSPIQNPKSKIQNASAVSASNLTQALDRELQAREYAWRMPRVPASDTDIGLLARFARMASEKIAGWMRTVVKWVRKALDWFGDRLPGFGGAGMGAGFAAMGGLIKTLLIVMLAVLACTAGVMLYRIWRDRDLRPLEIAARAAACPDLEDEGTTADELPEEGWLSLASELAAKGDLRLALRAVFLATLARLAQRELISIARFKSNLDYARELGRRAHAEPRVLGTFSQNVALYEPVWYGTHEATLELLNRIAPQGMKDE